MVHSLLNHSNKYLKVWVILIEAVETEEADHLEKRILVETEEDFEVETVETEENQKCIRLPVVNAVIHAKFHSDLPVLDQSSAVHVLVSKKVRKVKVLATDHANEISIAHDSKTNVLISAKHQFRIAKR